MEQPGMFKDLQFPPILDQPADHRWKLGPAAQHIVLSQFRSVVGWCQPVLDNLDQEAVHQIRVSARRTRSALQTFKHVWDAQQVELYLKALGKLAGRFGMARDLDVMLLYIAGSQARAYRPLAARLRSLRSAEQDKLQARLQEFAVSGMAGQLVDYFSRNPVNLWEMGGGDAG